ncbi:MAG: LPS-assembly protein LptD [Acidobacteria bacterium]|nr:LPS-assembly protein LptD [Acidobacteriota bacterium]
MAQDTNPVERQVANPLTDTPNVNPLSTQQNTVSTPNKKTNKPETLGGDDQLFIDYLRVTSEGKEGSRVITHTGNVDVHYGIYRLQADKITYYEADGRLVAEGSVVFDQGDDQRITGARGEFNYRTKLGFFVDSTGFTNQTDDGTIIYFTAERVERISANEVVVTNGKFTACDETTPKWSFTAREARVRTGDRIRLKGAKFRVLDVSIIPVPFASIPIKKRDRASGFLTPTFGFSGNKGARFSGAYYKTLGRSADVTFRGDLYTGRGIGFGMDVRTRANSRSFLNFGFYAVKDRLFGHKEDAEHPNQGGSLIYADGVHYFSNGFTAVADVRLTSNLAFRQVFSDGIQQIISPIEVSQAYVNKSWNNYTLNLLARSQVISIPNVRVKTKNLPSINFDKRPSQLSFFKKAYFSFKTSLEGVSRREDVDDVALYRQATGNDPVETPALGQRFDIHPQIDVPFNFKYFNLTATAGARVTYYSNSFDALRQVVGRDVIRKYGEFQLDLRPVALAKNYYGKENAFRFRHTIEPFLTYRVIKGINNFNRVIRFDFTDTQTDTNEIEYGVTNRIFTRRYTEAVSEEAQKRLRENPSEAQKNPLSVQPYEIFTLTVRGKFFFDKTFGGALVAGRRNQIAPVTDLTFYTFGGVPRRFSPLNIDATYRPRRTFLVNTRLDFGTAGEGLRAVSSTVGYNTKLLKIFQTFYYTRAVTLAPSLMQYNNAAGKEAGTLRGSQYSPAIFLGDTNRGFYGGASLFFDFENRRALRFTPLISSLYTVGYAFDCCALTAQYYTFNVGVRQENRFLFSFRLNGIGTFGTQQLGQGFR